MPNQSLDRYQYTLPRKEYSRTSIHHRNTVTAIATATLLLIDLLMGHGRMERNQQPLVKDTRNEKGCRHGRRFGYVSMGRFEDTILQGIMDKQVPSTAPKVARAPRGKHGVVHDGHHFVPPHEGKEEH
jgi:hypothetical protein